ncbi:MAG: energy-coupled thiamine transporter ThiT, partial [Anaerovoracaceae bacterium]
ISGIIFFSEFAPEGFNAIAWSLWYNLTYLGAEAAVTMVVLAVPAVRKMIDNFAKELKTD